LSSRNQQGVMPAQLSTSLPSIPTQRHQIPSQTHHQEAIQSGQKRSREDPGNDVQSRGKNARVG
jgi:hypothetical protein